MGRLGVGSAILEELSIFPSHIGCQVVIENSGAPRTHSRVAYLAGRLIHSRSKSAVVCTQKRDGRAGGLLVPNRTRWPTELDSNLSHTHKSRASLLTHNQLANQLSRRRTPQGICVPRLC